jgi:hypothetical protein
MTKGKNFVLSASVLFAGAVFAPLVILKFGFSDLFPLSETASAAEVASKAGSARPIIEFTADGKIRQPVGYRQWISLGAVVTPNDMNGGEASFPEFHNVYMDPESFAYAEKHGEYRDGTVIVKELLSVGSKVQSSGNGYFEGEFTGLEVSIKDSKRFADEPGNWAYFSFGHKYPLKVETAMNATASCNSCHEQNATNFVFSGVYPILNDVLKQAKAH